MLGHRHQRVEAEAPAVAEDVEGCGAGAVSDQLRIERKALRRRVDLAVGHAQQHHLRAGLRSAAQRALDFEAGILQGGGQGVAKPTGADDGAALKG